MTKYRFLYFWNDSNSDRQAFTVNCQSAEMPTIDDIYNYAEILFQQSAEELGYSKREIETADYQLAVLKGWCV